jgi:hypothetical protein
VTGGGIFTMSGAEALISGNYCGGNGGGVSVYGGIFTMSGENARISGNTAAAGGGGGVALDAGGTFTMSGADALISGNTAITGGGVFRTGGNFTMEAGEILGNSASNFPQFAETGSGSQRWPEGTHGSVYLNGTSGFPSPNYERENGGLIHTNGDGDWYHIQTASTVIKAVKVQ